METEHVKEFLVMADKLNYTAASDELFISQSSLFKHIRALEDELGVAFFAKEGKRVVMTEYGKMFVHHAEIMLRQIQTYKAEVEAHREAQEKTLNIMIANPNAELEFAFRKAFPQYKLNSEHLSNIEDTEKTDAEIIILRGSIPELEENWDHQDLATDSLVVIAPNDHPVAARKSVKLIDLKNEDFIGFSARGPHVLNNRFGMMYDVVSICRGAGFEPNVIMSAFPGSEIARLVSQGGGISILFKKATMRRLGDQVSYVDIEPSLIFPIRAYHRKGKKLSEVAQAYLKFTKEWYQSLYSK